MAFGHSKSRQLGWAAPKSCWHPGLLGRHQENAPESLKAGINERIDEGGGTSWPPSLQHQEGNLMTTIDFS